MRGSGLRAFACFFCSTTRSLAECCGKWKHNGTRAPTYIIWTFQPFRCFLKQILLFSLWFFRSYICFFTYSSAWLPHGTADEDSELLVIFSIPLYVFIHSPPPHWALFIYYFHLPQDSNWKYLPTSCRCSKKRQRFFYFFKRIFFLPFLTTSYKWNGITEKIVFHLFLFLDLFSLILVFF